MNEDAVREELITKFDFLKNKIHLYRARRLSVDVDYVYFKKVFEYALHELDFGILCAITGLDEGEDLGFIYHLSTEGGMLLNIHTSLPKAKPLLETITGYFPCADIYERELVDLLGAEVQGLPEGKKYPLTDDWPAGEYPLRKDWKRLNERTKEPKNERTQ